MIKVESKIRVRYGETDKMGFVYYGNYPLYFEVGRTDLIRNLGLTYKDIENSGVLMPVHNVSINYIKPGKYDELLTVKTYLKELPKARIKFEYEILNEQNEIITTGETTLFFLNNKTLKPMKAPDVLLSVLSTYF
ncbi:acyl-CoA thioesterase [Bacteroidota bacterium]